MIYLASPYSALSGTDPDSAKRLRHLRFCQTMAAQKVLFNYGYPVFATIVHTHITVRTYGLPTDAEFWKTYNHHMIDLSTAVFVLRLLDWEKSIGVADEIDYAIYTGKPIHPIEVEFRGEELTFSIPNITELRILNWEPQIKSEPIVISRLPV